MFSFIVWNIHWEKTLGNFQDVENVLILSFELYIYCVWIILYITSD